MTPKIVALKCWSSNEHYNADFDYAIVTLSLTLVEQIANRRRMLQDACQVDSNLLQMDFYECNAEYRSEDALERWADANERGEWIDNLQLGSETEVLPEVLPERFALPEDVADRFRSECDRIEVTADGVRWRSIPKHSSVTITTATLTYIELEQFTSCCTGKTFHASNCPVVRDGESPVATNV